MRNAFVYALFEAAKKDARIMLVTGDLGFMVLEKFRDELPSQYLNAGVSEQNMVSVAAGLAMSGKIVFTYSIIPFATYRCLEQIRNDVCYHQLPVCIVGVGAGYSYGYQGATHHALEDIGVMRSIPGMSVVSPGDPHETTAAVDAVLHWQRPCYLRLAKAGEPVIHQAVPNLRDGQGLILRQGTDVALIVTGNMLETAAKATEFLEQAGVSVQLLSMPVVKPIDEQIIASAANAGLVVTLEEHSSIGGLGSVVAEVMMRRKLWTPLVQISGPETFAKTIGSQNFLRKEAGLDTDSVVKRILAEYALGKAKKIHIMREATPSLYTA